MSHHLMQGDLALPRCANSGRCRDAVHEGKLALLDQRPHCGAGQHLVWLTTGTASQPLAWRSFGAGLGVAIAAEEGQLAVLRPALSARRDSVFLDMLADQPVEMLQRRRAKAEANGIGRGQGSVGMAAPPRVSVGGFREAMLRLCSSWESCVMGTSHVLSSPMLQRTLLRED